VTEQNPILYVISDALGETAEFVGKAAAAQFNGVKISIRRISYVLNESQIDEILEEAAKEEAILAYTLVLTNLRIYIEKRAKEMNLVTIDILGPLIDALAKKTNMQPKNTPNILHRLDEQYFRKVEAVEFAVKYDDCKDPRGILYADVVLIGVSRTSKTPLSMYLAHKGIKTANIPLVPEVKPPRELFEVSPKKVFGLTLDPEKLNEIRRERLKTLGLGVSADYASLNRIMEEIEYADKIMKQIGCLVIDTTSKAVEETASIIMKKIYQGGR